MTAPKELRAFQLTLGKYLRSPETEQRPFELDARRVRVYEELVFNNVSGFINTCFPVLKSLTTEQMWQQLIRAFFKGWRASSPLFKDIPEEFLQYLQQSELLAQLPAWTFELAHYEWVELYLETANIEPPEAEPEKITLNQPVLPLIYQWPVHNISADFQPNEGGEKQGQQTCLIVYRDGDNQVRFIETNPATILLLQLLEKEPLTELSLFEQLASALERPCDSQFQGFCQQIVAELTEQGVLL